MLFIENWINLIYKVSTGDWRTKFIIAPIAAICYVSLIVAFIFLAFMADSLLGLPDAFWYPWGLAAGILLILLGGLILFVSIAFFVTAMGTPIPFCPPPELVITGPYRFVRNPMQSGLFMQLFGLGIATGSLSLIFFFTPLFIALSVWELKKVEEPELVRRLGQGYVEYRDRTPMFFPFRIKR